MILLAEKYVGSKGDMDAVEEFVMRQMGCENHRCAYFRSSDYVRFRVGVLYKKEKGCSLYFDRLCLKSEGCEDGMILVKVFLNDDVVFEGKKGCFDQCFEKQESEKKNCGSGSSSSRGIKRCRVEFTK
jgi:hypothetical protein